MQKEVKSSPSLVSVVPCSSILLSKSSLWGQVPVLWLLTFPPPHSFYLSLTFCHTWAVRAHRIKSQNKHAEGWEKRALCVQGDYRARPLKRCFVSVVLKASCSSPDSAPHFLPQINRINVLKSNLVGFRVKLPGCKNNRRRLVATQKYHASRSGPHPVTCFYTRQSDFCSHPGRSPFQQKSTYCCVFKVCAPRHI